MGQKNILIVTQWGYEEGLIQSYTLPYLKIIHNISPGSRIYLITQEKSGLNNNKEKLATIKKDLSGHNIILLAEKYHRAGFLKYIVTSFTLLKHIWLIFTKKISYIHSFCTPAGSYAYILAKLTGRPLVIDSYEPHSEYMKDSGAWSPNSFAYRFLCKMEKKQALKARHIIYTTPSMVSFTEQRFNIKLKNGFIKPACVDLEKFNYKEKESLDIRKELKLENKIIGVYAGKFGDFYLKEEIFELISVASRFWGERLHILLLSDLGEEELMEYCRKFSLERGQFTLMKSPYDLMPDYLSVADFAISPYKPAPSKKFCTPIKNGEYWAIGLPIIITKEISVDSDIIEQNDIGYVLKDLSLNEYERAVKKIDDLIKKDRRELRTRIRAIAIEKRSFGIAKAIYENIYH